MADKIAQFIAIVVMYIGEVREGGIAVDFVGLNLAVHHAVIDAAKIDARNRKYFFQFLFVRIVLGISQFFGGKYFVALQAGSFYIPAIAAQDVLWNDFPTDVECAVFSIKTVTVKLRTKLDDNSPFCPFVLMPAAPDRIGHRY